MKLAKLKTNKLVEAVMKQQIDVETSNGEMAVLIVCEGFRCYTRVWSKKYHSEYYLEFSTDELTKFLAAALYEKFETIVSNVFETARKN